MKMLYIILAALGLGAGFLVKAPAVRRRVQAKRKYHLLPPGPYSSVVLELYFPGLEVSELQVPADYDGSNHFFADTNERLLQEAGHPLMLEVPAG